MERYKGLKDSHKKLRDFLHTKQVKKVKRRKILKQTTPFPGLESDEISLDDGIKLADLLADATPGTSLTKQ